MDYHIINDDIVITPARATAPSIAIPGPIIIPPDPLPLPTLLSVTVTSPNGGETFQPGQSVSVTWASSGADQHVVKYASDGANFVDISPALSASARSFAWVVPAQLTNIGRIRVAVRDTLGNRVTDDSNGTFSIAAPAAPQISSLNPTSGSVNGGTVVQINGANFVPGCVAKFGGVDAITTFISASLISAITPAASTSGSVTVRVVNPDGQVAIAQNAYTYTQVMAQAPQISSLNPTSGSVNGGTVVQINGANFVPGCVAKFGGTNAQVTQFVNSSQLTATTPAGTSTGPVTVRVVNPDGQVAIAQNAYTYTQVIILTPQITSFSPVSGSVAGGTVVQINGGSFVPGCVAKFGDRDASTTFVSPSQLLTITPGASTSGPVTVRVVNPDGQAGIAQSAFTYTQVMAQTPQITSINPNSGPISGGTLITVNGSNFVGGANGSKVKVAGMDATTTFVSTTQLTAITPPVTAPGFVTVRVVNPDGQVAIAQNAFQYLGVALGPVISTVAPSSGSIAGGTAVTITGMNFASGCTVRFGTMNAAIGNRTATQITVTSPVASVAGLVNIIVTNPDGQSATLANGFQYLPAGAPMIVSVQPNSGPLSGGTSVVVRGMNFVPGSTVRVGGNQPLSMIYRDTTEIDIVTPPRQTAGSVDVVVTNNPGGLTSTLHNGFTYVAQGAQGAGFALQSASVIDPDPTPGDIDPSPLTGNDTLSVHAGKTLTIQGSYTFNDPSAPVVTINPSITGLPAGTTGTFSPAQPRTGQQVTVTITTSATATPVGTYQITIGGRAIETGQMAIPTRFNLEVLPPKPKVSVLLGVSSLLALTGTTAQVPLTIKRRNFPGQVTFVASSVPTGVTASFNPGSTVGDSSTLNLALLDTAEPGVFTVRISVVANGLSIIKDALLALTVQRKQQGTLSLTVSPSNVQEALPGIPGVSSQAFFNIGLSDVTTTERVSLKLNTTTFKAGYSVASPIDGDQITGRDTAGLGFNIDYTAQEDQQLEVEGFRANGQSIGKLALTIKLRPAVRVYLTGSNGARSVNAAPGQTVKFTAMVFRAGGFAGQVRLDVMNSRGGLINVPPVFIAPGMGMASGTINIPLPADIPTGPIDVTVMAGNTDGQLVDRGQDQVRIEVQTSSKLVTLQPSQSPIIAPNLKDTPVTIGITRMNFGNSQTQISLKAIVVSRDRSNPNSTDSFLAKLVGANGGSGSTLTVDPNENNVTLVVSPSLSPGEGTMGNVRLEGTLINDVGVVTPVLIPVQITMPPAPPLPGPKPTPNPRPRGGVGGVNGNLG